MEALGRDQRIWARLWELVEGKGMPASTRVKARELAARLCGMFKRLQDAETLSTVHVEEELRRRLHGYAADR